MVFCLRLVGTVLDRIFFPSHHTLTLRPRQLILTWCQASWSICAAWAAFVAMGSRVMTLRVRPPKKGTSFSTRVASVNSALTACFWAAARALAWASASIWDWVCARAKRCPS